MKIKFVFKAKFMREQSVDKTVFVYIAGECYDSLAKINVKGRNRIRLYNIPVRRNHLGSELFLCVGIRKFCPTSETKITRRNSLTLTSVTMSSPKRIPPLQTSTSSSD